ncbi:MAG: vitamin B12 transporter [Lentisphaeria bacterium]|jgi:vitamin B12 transporter
MKHLLLLPIFTLVAATSYSKHLRAEKKLEEVVVTSSRTATPLREVGVSVTVVELEEIQLRGYSSLVDVLRSQPGITASNAGGPGKVSTVRIRGEEGFRTLVMIDGVSVSDPTSPQVGPQLQHMSASSDIEKVEILRGPQGFIYGADAGGVVNIFTRTPERGIEAQTSVVFGRYDSSLVNAFVAAGSTVGDASLSVNKQKTDGFNANTNDQTEDRDGYDNTTLHSKFGWNISEKLKARLIVRDVDAESEYDACGFFDPEDNCLEKFKQTTARLSADYKGSTFSHTLGFANTDIDRENFAGDLPSFAFAGNTTKADYVGSVAIASDVRLVMGADAGTEHVDVEGGDDLERDQSALFAELRTELLDSFYINGGIRADDNEDFGTHTSVRLTAAFVQALGALSNVKYRASVGNGFRAPSLYELAYNANWAFGDAAQTDLSEENSEGFDVGVDYYSAAGITLELTYFNQTIEDEIYFDLVDFSGYLQDLGSSSSKGFEFGLEYPVTAWLALQGNIMFNKTKTSEGLQRISRPEKSGSAGAKFTLLSDKLSLLASLRFARDAVGTVRETLDDYEVLDISASYRVNKTVEFFGRIENATDEDYQEITGFNTSDRAAYAGARLKF